ncbi:hypothetical protein HDU97_003903 [Phlyctochytrium planicorne]|nr:hypothetical protein HDU97_003903 [Phlyctochytrium planicorne]
MPVLKLVDERTYGEYCPHTMRLPDAHNPSPILIGRIGETLNFSLLSRLVSRTHAKIEFIEGIWYLTDMKSMNGTAVDGIRLRPGIPSRMWIGCRVEFGPMKEERGTGIEYEMVGDNMPRGILKYGTYRQICRLLHQGQIRCQNVADYHWKLNLNIQEQVTANLVSATAVLCKASEAPRHRKKVDCWRFTKREVPLFHSLPAENQIYSDYRRLLQVWE